MRVLALLKKTFLENLREWKILILTLTFAPFFLYLMYAYFEATAPAYRLLVVNQDAASLAQAPPPIDGPRELLAAWRAAAHPDGRQVFAVTEMADVAAAEARLRNRDADMLVVFPRGFSASLVAFRDGKSTAPARLANHADEGNARALMAMALSDVVAFGYAATVTRAAAPLELDVRRVGSGRALSEFDLYLPALFVLALIMVMFTAAASLIKEVDRGTINRLLLSRLSLAELLAAVSMNQVLIGLVTLALTFLAALSVGYRTDGSTAAILVVGGVATLGVIALSVVVAAFLNTIFELLTVGCFPFFLLLFFSESMMPLPKVSLLQMAGHVVYLNDVLPTSLAVRAFGKVLNHGAGLGGVLFELGLALSLTACYFALGAWLFARRHYRIK